MKYAVNDEGVQALNAMAQAITDAVDELHVLISKLRSAAGEYNDTLGPHKASLDAALNDIESSLQQATEPAHSVAEKLKEVAEDYQDIIDNDPYSSIDASNTPNGKETRGTIGGRVAGFFTEVFGSGGSSGSGEIKTEFDGLSTGKLNNGAVIIQGDHFEQYVDDYYNSEETSFESLSDSIIVETIAPTQIEGIHLGDSENKDPSVFWGMHSSSKEFFVETASHIPEVQEALHAGVSLEELRNNPVLGACASIYFDPRNIPRVEKNDGYYTFDGDGRHRIIAARLLGYSIPVRIIGIRHRNKH